MHGKATFNLLGGYVSFVMDVSRANAQVNTNFYTSSPASCCAYCDIQKNKSPPRVLHTKAGLVLFFNVF